MIDSNIRSLVRGAYDTQKLRIQTGLRLVNNFKVKLGIEPGKKEDEEKEAKKILEQIKKDYDLVTDGVAAFPDKDKFVGHGVISTYTEYCLLTQYFDLLKVERTHFRRLEANLDGIPIYDEYLKDIRGIGPAMAGVIISEIDIHKARYVTSLWKYAGVDVAADGKGRSRRSEHLIDVEYKTKKGEMETRRSITFNPFLKTKLTGVMAGSLLRSGNEQYSQVYADYKHRLENHTVYKDVTKAHRNRMALRYMVKIFLQDLYAVWRPLEGLSVAVPYHEAKLGLKHVA